MQVILLEQVKKLGNTGDLVKVKGGYGRNYLIPNKMALRATKDNIAFYETKKADIEKENAKKLEAASKVEAKIKDKVVTLIQQAGEDGRLYGSVHAADIAKALTEETKEEISRKQIALHSPIKYIGIHSVEVHLHGEVATKIHVNVARSASEAKDAAKRFAKGEVVMEGPTGEEKAEGKDAEASQKSEGETKKKSKKSNDKEEDAVDAKASEDVLIAEEDDKPKQESDDA